MLLCSAAALAEHPDDETLMELVSRVGRARWTSDNSVELLDHPVHSWQARRDLAASARHHLLISTFSWYKDEHGREFRDLLEELVDRRAAAGEEMDVRVLMDASTLWIFSSWFDSLEERGAKVRGFNRSTGGLSAIYDGRMHDKVMIADGRTAIVGGRNFADIYYDPYDWWLDLGVLVRGSAVHDLQMNFLKAWELTHFIANLGRFLLPEEKLLADVREFWWTGRYPNGRSPLRKFMTADYFQRWEQPPGAGPVAVLYDNSLLRRRAATTDLAVELVKRAERSVDLMTPFPNLPEELTRALLDAADRGVEVRLLTNGRDTALRGGPYLWLGYPTIIRMIEGGVEVWAWRANRDTVKAIAATECRPSLMPPIALHGKMLRVDDEISIVHSSNFNIRSTYYNTEAGVVVLDRSFNRRLGKLVDGLIALEDFELDCSNGDPGPPIGPLLEQLDADDLSWIREDLGGKQSFVEKYSVAW